MYNDDIFFVQTNTTDKNIGRGYNNHIKYLPDHAIIIITDCDTNFLLPNFSEQLYHIANSCMEKYALIGAVTNRVGNMALCYNNELSNNHDMLTHFERAEELQKGNYGIIEPVNGVSGHFMMFKKETWSKVGGFVEGTVQADTLFNKAIKRKKLGLIGLAKGVYIYHCYRINDTMLVDARKNTKHLF